MENEQIIESKIISFFERFALEQGVEIEGVKLVIKLLDNSTNNLTPLYEAHSVSISKYCLISEIIQLNALERMAVSYTSINNSIGKFFVKKSVELDVKVNQLKGLIQVRKGVIQACLFVNDKQGEQFKVSDFLVKKG